MGGSEYAALGFTVGVIALLVVALGGVALLERWPEWRRARNGR